MPDEPEVRGLLALMLLHHSRRDARAGRARRAGAARRPGPLALASATRSARGSRSRRAPARDGPYALQAADRRRALVGRDRLGARGRPLRTARRAAAGARGGAQPRRGRGDGGGPGARPRAGRRRSSARARSSDYHLLHAARADLLRRLGRAEEAAVGVPAGAASWRPTRVERAFLERRLAELVSA